MERRRIDGGVMAENLDAATSKILDEFSECPDFEIIDFDISLCQKDVFWYEVYDEYMDT
jgi:hypothetical protein